MSHPRFQWIRFILPLVIFILGCPPSGPLPPDPDIVMEPDPLQEPWGVQLLGSAVYLAPESQGSLLVHVRNPYTGEPQAAAAVAVHLDPAAGDRRELFRGRTDELGLLPVNFAVPASLPTGEGRLTVIAETEEAGQIQTAQEVYIGQVFNLLLSTDKPVYQPGQTIHLRTLALERNALGAARGETLQITVADPEGNKLMRRELITSDFGIAAVDFQLDSQAASGDYILTATMGPISSSRTVEVKPYTLPRFAITFTSDERFYLPGATVTGTVDAHYFFGKPVVGGQVQIDGYVTDVERFHALSLSGTTDDSGRFTYTLQVPDYFVGQLENNTAKLDLEITVVDAANHSERIDEQITVAEQTLLIEAIPESGQLRPGLENILYLQSTTPDGRAVQTTMHISSEIADLISGTAVITTDLNGLATVTVVPPTERELPLSPFTVRATPIDGEPTATVEQQVLLRTTAGPASVLLRPERVEYQVGDTLNIDIHVAGTATTAYLDVIKDGQTFGLAALPVNQGVAQAAIAIDGSLLGTLELNAYVISSDPAATGEIVRDRRLVLVNPAPATVSVTSDAAVYRPGDRALLDIAVARAGAPMPSAIGLSIVDESVFAIGTQDPGFARTYFLLERELQEPRYEIHDFVPLRADDPSPYDGGKRAQADGGKRAQAEQNSAARQLALAGFFAEELAWMAEAEAVVESNASADLNAANFNEAVPAEAHVLLAGSPAAQDWAGALGTRVALAAPLLGLALYNGTRRRRRLLLGLVVVSAILFWTSCAAPAASPVSMDSEAASEAPAPAEAMADETTATRGDASAPPRLRQFFPETLLWLPELTTDAEGKVQVEVPIADSITTWRVSVLASDQAGNLGSAEIGLRVFQDFFVEPDLPRFLTVGDEIAVPVSIFNYLDEPQEITLAIAAADWFEFVDAAGSGSSGAEQIFTIGANEVTAVYIPIRVTTFGEHDFQITATGSAMSDAVLKAVAVLPAGQRIANASNGKLVATQRLSVTVPAAAIPGTAQVTVKVYPGVISQIVDGLEGMLQQPYGCFEQTSSTTYPNVLVLDYLKRTGQINPRVQLQAEQFINLGYQRLLSFEVNGVPGGFSLFGDPPPQTMLTAYGLMEFTDMSQVSYVDPALIERTANFLLDRQQPDGSWRPQGMTIESGLEDLGNDSLLPTAYLVWALADAGYAEQPAVQRGVVYLQQQLEESAALQPQSQSAQRSGSQSPLARTRTLDPYAAALVLNALVAAAPDTATGAIDQLVAQLLVTAETDTDGYYSWSSGMTNYLGGHGNVSNIETAAMSAIALLRLGQHLDVAQGAIDSILRQRDPNGMFYTTQTTVLALKALLLAAEQSSGDSDATVTVTLNGERVQTLNISAENSDVVQLIRFDDLPLRNLAGGLSAGATDGGSHSELAIFVEGDRSLQYQVITEYYLPWDAVPTTPIAEQDLQIDLYYDRTELQVNDIVDVEAAVTLLAPGTAGTLLVDLGIPPGFRPLVEDWDRLVEQGVIERYEFTGRQIIVYLTEVPSGRLYTLPYRLQARFPIQAQTPSSSAYDYYTPTQQQTTKPQRIVVTLGTPAD